MPKLLPNRSINLRPSKKATILPEKAIEAIERARAHQSSQALREKKLRDFRPRNEVRANKLIKDIEKSMKRKIDAVNRARSILAGKKVKKDIKKKSIGEIIESMQNKPRTELAGMFVRSMKEIRTLNSPNTERYKELTAILAELKRLLPQRTINILIETNDL